MPIGSTLDVVIQQDDLVVLGPPSIIDVAVDIGPRGEAGTQIYTGAFNPNDLSQQQFQDIYGDIPRLNDMFLRTDEGPNYGSFYQFTNVPGNDQWEITVDFINAIELSFGLNPDFPLKPKSGGTGVNNGVSTISVSGNFQTLGGFPLDLSVSGSTSLILPTFGNVAVHENKLNVFTPTTSSELASVITDETGTGQLVFNVLPEIQNGINTSSETFNFLTSNVEVLNLASSASVINIGGALSTTVIDGDLTVNGSFGDINGTNLYFVSGNFSDQVFGVSPTSSASFTTKDYVDNVVVSGNLPSQSGQEGKYLSTSGSVAFWTDIAIPPSEIIEKTSDHTLELSDAQKIIEVNSASATIITIPADSSIDFPVGSNIDIVQTGAGQITIAGEGGVSLLSKDSNNKTNSQYSGVTIYKKSSNTWVLIGDLSS